MGEKTNLVPGRLDLLDGDDVKARIPEIPLDDRAGDGIVSGSNNAFRAQCFHRADLVRAGGEDRDAVFVLPSLHDALLARKAVQHEGRRSFRMDEIDLQRSNLGDAALVLRHHGLEFLNGAIFDSAIDGMGPHAGRQQTHQRIMRPGALLRCRLDHPDKAAIAGLHHDFSPARFSSCRRRRERVIVEVTITNSERRMPSSIIRRRRARAIATLAAFIICLSSFEAATQSVEQHFRGKQIRLLIGSSAGGGYDLFARTIAAYWPKHIPGNPGIVPQNVPGALSLQVANNIFSIAPKDGTVIGAVNPLIVPRAILDPGAARFDARQFTWIGSALREYQLAIARSDAPVKTFEHLFKTELMVGGSGGATDAFPIITNAVLGTKFKVISGYPGTREVNLALDRNEVQGIGGITWASIKATMTAMLAEKRINLIVQFGMKMHPELPHVPHALKYAAAAEQHDALMLPFATQEFGRPYLAPPGPARADCRRAAGQLHGDDERPRIPGGGDSGAASTSTRRLARRSTPWSGDCTKPLRKPFDASGRFSSPRENKFSPRKIKPKGQDHVSCNLCSRNGEPEVRDLSVLSRC